MRVMRLFYNQDGSGGGAGGQGNNGGQAQGNAQGQGNGGGGSIPYDRFQTVVQERNNLQGKVSDLERQVQTLAEKGATADTLAAQLREAQQKFEAERSAWGTERAIVGAGITDPEGVEFARLAYERIKAGEDGKKPSITDWLGQRDALPKAVRAYLPDGTAQQGQGGQQGQGANAGGQQGQQQGGQAQGGQQQGKGPAANGGVKSYSGAPAAFTPEAIRSMTPEQYKASREAILAAQAGR